MIEHEYIKERLHKNSFQISAQEMKQPEKPISNGITLQSHQAINETIQQENALPLKEDGIESDTVGVKNAKFLENGVEKEQVEEGRREREKVPDSVTPSEEQGNVKQDRLLLDGPGQRYRLEKGGNIPELQNDREILIQVSPVPLGTLQHLISY